MPVFMRPAGCLMVQGERANRGKTRYSVKVPSRRLLQKECGVSEINGGAKGWLYANVQLLVSYLSVCDWYSPHKTSRR